MMTINYFSGDLLNTTDKVIVHQVNALGGFGSGVAGALARKWPEVREAYKTDISTGKLYLGKFTTCETNDGKHTVVHMCGQYNYGGDGKLYTSYGAFFNAMREIREWCEKNGIENISMPYKIGCGLAGGNWPTVLALIEDAFLTSDITISFWKI